jgi:hypothetical protein
MAALDPQKLAERISELTKAYQRQVEKAGQPSYDPTLTELLKKDLDWMQHQVEKFSYDERGDQRENSQA